MPSWTPYANNQRIDVTLDNGEQWWVAPDGRGNHIVMPHAHNQHPGDPVYVKTLEDGVRHLLGDHAEACLAELGAVGR